MYSILWLHSVSFIISICYRGKPSDNCTINNWFDVWRVLQIKTQNTPNPAAWFRFCDDHVASDFSNYQSLRNHTDYSSSSTRWLSRDCAVVLSVTSFSSFTRFRHFTYSEKWLVVLVCCVTPQWGQLERQIHIMIRVTSVSDWEESGLPKPNYVRTMQSCV